MIEKDVEVSDYVSPSKLCNYTINPYVGCPHACRYCYASFMKRFTEHEEPWGEFLDVKRCSKPLGAKRLTGKTVFMSSVTDCYNPWEAKYGITRRILEELAPIECELSITTKSDLLLRDLDLLKARTELFRRPKTLFDFAEPDERCGIRVLASVNTLDEGFRTDMDRASPIAKRLEMLKVCHAAGIPTLLFMSPIFPHITDFRAIVDAAASYVDAFWFENLNLRPDFEDAILFYIRERYPQYFETYLDIYRRGDLSYWRALKEEIKEYCEHKGVAFQLCFHY